MDITKVSLTNGTEVRKEQLLEIAESYISGLDNPDMIYKSSFFRGMLKQIYISLFKPIENYRSKDNSIIIYSLLNYDDIESINLVFSWYTELAYKYNQSLSILAFCLMTGISRDTISDWKDNTTRKSNIAYTQTVKKWLSECELSALDSASSGNPGGMFILKACYGYTETPQQIIVNSGSALPQQTIEQIAERRKKDPLQLPEKPDISDES